MLYTIKYIECDWSEMIENKDDESNSHLNGNYLSMGSDAMGFCQ